MNAEDALELAKAIHHGGTVSEQMRRGQRLAAYVIERETPIPVKQGVYISQADYATGCCEAAVSLPSMFCPICGLPLDWSHA